MQFRWNIKTNLWNWFKNTTVYSVRKGYSWSGGGEMSPPTRCGRSSDLVWTSKSQEQEKKRIRWVSWGGGKVKASLGLLYQGSHSMNHLTSALHSYSHFPLQCLKSRSNRDLIWQFVTVNWWRRGTTGS